MAGPAAVVADIGGTTARFAFYDGHGLGAVTSLSVADHADFESALAAFLAAVPRPPARAAFAVAGPVEGARARLTNGPWRFDATALKARFGFAAVTLVNDFAAAALSLPRLTAGDLRPIGGGRAVAGAPRAVLGPGTGLGVATLVEHDGAPIAVAAEGGHVTMAAATRREDAVIETLRGRLGHVSAERVVSGDGLVNLAGAIAALDGAAPAAETPEAVMAAGLAGTSPACVEALAMFCAMLGTIAGNLALTVGARGGVYIGGGIVPRMIDYLAASGFRHRFEDKGRFRSYLAAIPTAVVVRPDFALLGLASLVEGP